MEDRVEPKSQNVVAVLLIFIFSLLIMMLYAGFEKEAYLYDDNRTQWYPVIEKAYEQLFTDGTLPSYNFYLAKGLPISDPGYYGLLNPFMLVSYVIAHVLPWGTNTIAVYTCLMTSLGCIMIFCVCRKLDIGITASVTAAAALLSCSIFIVFFYWYYVFNNIFFIPLLIYVFLKFRNTKAEYFACGVVLAFDIFCGNVQYTFYHYMMYCILSLMMILSRKKNSLKAAVSNIFIGIFLSLPIFIMLIRASNDFGGNNFMSKPMYFFAFVFNFLFPKGIFDCLKAEPPKTNFDSIYYSAACVLPMIICIVPYCKKMIKDIKAVGLDSYVKAQPSKIKVFFENDRNVVILGVFVSYLVFMNICDGGIVAEILSRVPIVSNFRFLFKAMFIVVPILSVLTAVLLNSAKGRIRTAALLTSAVCILIGIGNNVCIYKDVRAGFLNEDQIYVEEEKEYLLGIIEEHNMDLKNYRSICLYCHSNISKPMFNYSKNISRNFPAYAEVFSLSAYEMSLSEDVMEQYDMIYDTTEKYSNAGAIEYLYENIVSDPQKTEEQLIKNGIKHIIVQREAFVDYEEMTQYLLFELTRYQNFTDELAKTVDSLENISVEEVRRFNDEYDLIILSGVDPICTDSSGNMVLFDDERMDMLSFEPNGSESYTLQMTYNSNLYAEYTDIYGNATMLDIAPDDTGNILISSGSCSGGKIRVGCFDKVFVVGIICEITVLVLLIVVLAAPFICGRKSSVNTSERTDA